jgi:hypothetical protein
MIKIKPTPVNTLSTEPYKSIETQMIYFIKNTIYLDSRLKVEICSIISTDMRKKYKFVYVDNITKNCECGSHYNRNGTVKRKINKLEGVYVQQYICPSMPKNTHC